MSYKVLYRKYRPDDFDNVVGQDYTVGMLKNAISSGKNAHAYIFTGPRGTGKTSSAKIFAKALNCLNPVNGSPCNECESCISFKDSPDIIEIDAASNNGVDEIRELINNVKLVPSNSKYKVYIIDEVHMLTTSAFNALLLTLEEPPSHVVFILATTDIQNVPITILSRCQRFDFKPINKESLIHRLDYVCKEENIKITADALEEIALISAGGMRDALGMLDQLANSDEEITLDSVSSYFGSVSPKVISELLDSIAGNNVESLLEILGNIRTSGTNYTVFVEKLISELRKAAVSIKSSRPKYNISFDTVYNLIFDLNECLCNININVDPYLLIEVVLLKYINSSGNNYNNQTVDLGNNIAMNVVNNGNSLKKEVDINSNIKDNSVNNVINDKAGNNEEPIVLKENKKETTTKTKKEKKQVIHKITFDLNTRINNCFVGVEMKYKKSLKESWGDFVSYLLAYDKSLISLLADVDILAVSNEYALISSKIESTNSLINESIRNLEKFYADFSGNNYKFAALSNDLWKKESAKYLKNKENNIKYNYIEEELVEESVEENIESNGDSNIEDLASDIFGTFEVE